VSRAAVGFVVVSHSEKVAEGVCEMARGLSGGQVEIQAAGGDELGGLGVTPEKVLSALRDLEKAGVEDILVFCDLGSSVNVTKALLDEEPALKDTVHIMDAPIVEGTISAVIAALMP
jgi:dihydroxyacetone kinase DhaKLM complex PTS-EIIA-like component DhaM